jgi:hypothetical protein
LRHGYAVSDANFIIDTNTHPDAFALSHADENADNDQDAIPYPAGDHFSG